MLSHASPRFDVARIQCAVIICFFLVGLSLGALPLFITKDLAADDTIVGLVIGSQFLASLLSRIFVGRLLQAGLRRCVLASLVGLMSYGLLLGISPYNSELAVPTLIFARVVQGVAVGTLATAAIMWAIDKLGESSTARVLSMTGISIYGAVACGAPAGILIFQYLGLPAVAGLIIALPIIPVVTLLRVSDIAPKTEQKTIGTRVFGKVLLPGSVLFLHGVGFVSIEAFVSLYFSQSGWPLVTWALSLFGVSFVLIRVSLGHLLQGSGLVRLAAASLSFQALGLTLLAVAPNQYWALLSTAIIGGSCSLTFPALGAIATGCCSTHERGTAMGYYSGFQDASYALTGPAIGLAINARGYGTGFFAAGICALLGLVLLSRVKR
ncbi:Major facilitator superfamily transporter [Alloalcanivorax dieselolei B5]|uniref:Major facilitator superfamily transporter n=1 Tax=Alcanivorax dieselolei (strain DSM 16502 / CGMCC 1.3690 / MCCC 1A00001 / B-5) TaxID=930169 RepID=K0CHD5_ALCDB|nr:MFS transporter [Alloalcanivorax dieselolei]AFT71041.1 Major facilitator superfamily transporter [Alloalcanivorax dieselolei B5]